jgi:hypothetical protein
LFAYWLALETGRLHVDEVMAALGNDELIGWQAAALLMGRGPELDLDARAELIQAASGFKLPFAECRYKVDLSEQTPELLAAKAELLAAGLGRMGFRKRTGPAKGNAKPKGKTK